MISSNPAMRALAAEHVGVDSTCSGEDGTAILTLSRPTRAKDGSPTLTLIERTIRAVPVTGDMEATARLLKFPVDAYDASTLAWVEPDENDDVVAELRYAGCNCTMLAPRPNSTGYVHQEGLRAGPPRGRPGPNRDPEPDGGFPGRIVPVPPSLRN